MLSGLFLAVVAGAFSLVAVKYGHALKDKSKKETIVIVKNANEFGKTVAPEVIEEPKLVAQPSRLYIKIPLPYPNEILTFVNMLSLIPLALLACAGTFSFFTDEKGIPSFWIMPYLYTVLSIIAYLFYALLRAINWEIIGEMLYYVVIGVTSLLSVYYLFRPCDVFVNESCENRWIKIVVLTFISIQYYYLKIPQKNDESIDDQ